MISSSALSERTSRAVFILVFAILTLLSGCERSTESLPEATAIPAAPSAISSEPAPHPGPPVLELPVEFLTQISVSPATRRPLTVHFRLPVDHERLTFFDPDFGFPLPPGTPWAHGSTTAESSPLEKHVNQLGRLSSLSEILLPDQRVGSQRTRVRNSCASFYSSNDPLIGPIMQKIQFTTDSQGIEFLLQAFGSCLTLETTKPTTREEVEAFLGREVAQAFHFCRSLQVESFCGSPEQGLGKLAYSGPGQSPYDLAGGRIEIRSRPQQRTVILGGSANESEAYEPSIAREDRSVWFRTGSPSAKAEILHYNRQSIGSDHFHPFRSLIWSSEDESLVCNVAIRTPIEGNCPRERHAHFESLPPAQNHPRKSGTTASPCRLSQDCVSDEHCTVTLFEGACVEYQHCAELERTCLPLAMNAEISEECAALFACHASPDCRALLIDDECRMADQKTFAEMLVHGHREED